MALSAKDRKAWKVQNLPKVRWFWTSFQKWLPAIALPYHHIFNREGQSCYSLLGTPQTRWSHPSAEQNSPDCRQGEAGCAGCRLLQLRRNQWRERHCHSDSPRLRKVSEVGGVTHPWGAPLHRCSQDPGSQHKLRACLSVLPCMTKHFFLCYLAHTWGLLEDTALSGTWCTQLRPYVCRRLEYEMVFTILDNLCFNYVTSWAFPFMWWHYQEGQGEGRAQTLADDQSRQQDTGHDVLVSSAEHFITKVVKHGTLNTEYFDILSCVFHLPMNPQHR